MQAFIGSDMEENLPKYFPFIPERKTQFFIIILMFIRDQ